MRLLQIFFILNLVIAIGCCDKPDKCNNQCGDRAICDDIGICQPKTREDFYNSKTGKYEQIFNIGFETFPNCFFYNYSYADTPWILPSLIEIDKHGVNLWSLTLDKNRDLYYYNQVGIYENTFNLDLNKKVTDLNTIFLSNRKFISENIFFDYNLETNYLNKNLVSSWVGKVSQDRKKIDFTIYIFINKTESLFENSDTVKIINRSYAIHPESKTDCRFCFDCE